MSHDNQDKRLLPPSSGGFFKQGIRNNNPEASLVQRASSNISTVNVLSNPTLVDQGVSPLLSLLANHSASSSTREAPKEILDEEEEDDNDSLKSADEEFDNIKSKEVESMFVPDSQPHADDSNNQDLSVVFHLYVHKNASKVILEFERPIQDHVTHREYPLDYMSKDDIGTYWRLSVPWLQNLSNVRYRYIVRYHHLARVGKVKHEDYYSRTAVNGRRNHYDVFKETNDKPLKPDKTFKGKMFHMKLIFDQLSKQWGNLSQILEDIEDIGFRDVGKLSDDSRKAFRDLVNETLNRKELVTPSTSAVICSLLGHFFQGNMPDALLETIFRSKRENADRLVMNLSQCKEVLPAKALAFIEHIHLEIIKSCTFRLTNLEYLFSFWHLFPVTNVIQTADRFHDTEPDRFDDIASRVIKTLVDLEDGKRKDMLMQFVMSKVPTIRSLLKLFRQLVMNESYERYEEIIIYRFSIFFAQEFEGDTNFLLWEEIPQVLKPKLAVMFLKATKLRMQGRQPFDDEFTFKLICDQNIQQDAFDELVKLLKFLSNSRLKKQSDVVVRALYDVSFLLFWGRIKECDRLEIVKNLTSAAMQSVYYHTDKSSKEYTTEIFLALDEFTKISALKGYESIMEKSILEELHQYDLRTIVSAYDEIEKTGIENIQKWYIAVAIECLKIKNADVNVKYKLLDHILALPSSQDEEMNRKKGDILLLLLDMSVVPRLKSRSVPNREEVWRVVDAVLSEKKMWTVVFEESLKYGHLSNHHKYLDVRSVMDKLTTSFIDGHISLNCIQNEEDPNKFADFLALGRCVPPGDNVSAISIQCEWIEILKKLLAERNKIKSEFDLLDKALRLAIEVAHRDGEETTMALKDVKSLLDKYHYLHERLGDTEFADIRQENYWGPLKSIVNHGKVIYKLYGSIFFKNFARKFLRKHMQRCQNETTVLQGQDGESDSHSLMVEEILMVLKEGVEAFKDVLKRISDQGSKVTSKEVDKLLMNIEVPRIKEEFESVREILSLPDLSENVLKMIKDFLRFDDVKTKILAALECLSAVGYTPHPLSDDDNFLGTLHSFLNCKACGTLKSVSEHMNQPRIVEMNNLLSPELVDTLSELSRAKELIDFIITTAKDNMVDLVEAVEEHSDQLIQASTVSYLIDVHRFFGEHLSNRPEKPEVFLKNVAEAYAGQRHASSIMGETITSSKVNIAAKIKVVSCHVHSLKSLHMMLSNREEVTKEIIKRAVKSGSYRVWIVDGLVGVQLTYEREDQNKTEAKYNIDDLNDLRSRALLLVNAEKMHKSAVDGEKDNLDYQKDLRLFIDQVDLLIEIVRKYKELKISGIPEYEKPFWKKDLKTIEAIRQEEARVNKEASDWNNMIKCIRKDCFFLNYFHTKQLWKLKSFFNEQITSAKEVSDEVLALFHFIDANITRDCVLHFHSKYVKPAAIDRKNELCAIGKTLEEIFRSSFKKSSPVVSSPISKNDAVVEPFKLYVGVLEPGSVQTVHVIMSLFENTCAARLPKPSQILFCNPQTTWDEIELLLLRTFEAHRHGFTSKLHCVANVENLPNDIHFKLVDKLEALVSSDAPYLLAIVCRGAHQHIADHFSDFAHFHGGMPDADMRETFKQFCPNTFLVTGDLPGLGKSEEIYAHAGEKGKAVVTFPISGPFVRGNLVKRLSELKLKPFQAIHFDVGEVEDPAGLDTFLFELIVTKMVSAEALIFSLTSNHVYIEVANTLQQRMRNSLPVCKSFKRLDVQWKDYGNLLSSKELTDCIQVVCQYLNAYENGHLGYREVVLSGSTKVAPITSVKCQELLKRHFLPGQDLNFNILQSFLSVLGDQLLKFSRSPYFMPELLKDMVGNHQNIRNEVLKALVETSTSFAVRSVSTCRAFQGDAVKAKETFKRMKAVGEVTAEQMVDRVNGMIQFDEICHLVIMFHTSGSITPIYRSLHDVPKNMKDLFFSQDKKRKGLEDYTKMSQDELQETLERVSDAPLNLNREPLKELNYALTPDNLLKMALTIQRLQSGIPVIIMGETGCGKTSLVQYLAQTCAIPFEAFRYHAGITEQQIIDFVSSKDKEARNLQEKGKSMWVFLDEINTCDYLGTINEIVCHRSIHGRPLASNLMFVAACNPYRLRPTGCIMTAGLTGKTSFDEFSKLVYRVYPLPETMIDYVWDYGSLSREDERAYIGRMVEKLFDGAERNMLVDLLATSQDFIRREDKSSFCVSLRDVHRATILMKWFYKVLHRNPQTIMTSDRPKLLQKFFLTSAMIPITEKAIVLSLAHCYLSRLPTSQLRQDYCSEMTKVFIKHGKKKFKRNAEAFQHIVRAEQEDYLSRMELPEGTAKNAALRENVFVILVCILNRIPVFIVGKPGCSKSLSMQIIRSNLRGRDLKDPFLQTLPKLLVVSFQCSESSTSSGIEKVFEKARKYKSESENVLPVVLLDEIGLAENSKFNALKVLHHLLETDKGDFPDVAVVGISNWALDAAKMNRAIHLSRPEPDALDLYETGLSISSVRRIDENSAAPAIECLAEAYSEYQRKQKHENFHGLRDYYSMVKCFDISRRYSEDNSRKIQRAMQRNFGGTTVGKGELQSAFLEKLKSRQPVGDVVEFHVTDLILDNLNDRMARHLMLITNGDSAIGILDQTLNDLNKEKITIFGSRFEEDLSADYCHRILSRIILCMEHNCILILRDLERIYGSLYDMLNQNYMVVGGKKNCRVALGAFSNPMCQVDDGFRCIVLVDEDKVDYSDPPFLNRFEKQLLRFSDILDERQRKLIKELCEWTESISSVLGHETQFDEFDMFAGFHEDTLPSLVLLHSNDTEGTDEEVLERCKDDMMTIAMPDAVIRSRNSKLNHMNDEEANELYSSYFEKPIHDGLKVFLEHTFKTHQESDHRSPGMMLFIMTHSSIHNDVSKSIEDLFLVQIEKLSFFKSEKELSKRIKHFWWKSEANLLVVQCRPETDAQHMLLVKTIIEEQRTAFIGSPQATNEKHVCILMHLRRSVEDECTYRWQFNFLSGWSQVMIECIEKPVIQIREMLEYSVIDVLLKSETVPFNKVATDQVLWCFTQIRFPTSKPPDLKTLSGMVSSMTSCPDIMECLMKLCCSWIGNQQKGSKTAWQIDVACDRQALINSSTLVKAMEYFIIRTVRLPLARIVYFLQKHSVFPALTCDDAATRQECLKLLSNESIFNIDEIPPPQGAESLVVEFNYADLRFPFSTFFCDKVDALMGFYTDEHRNHCLEQENVDENGELTSNARKVLVRKIAMKVEQVITEITESPILTQQLHEYVDDFLDIKTDDASDVLSRDQRIAIMKAHYGEKMPEFTESDPVDAPAVVAQLHCSFWIEDNAFPEVLAFIRDCVSINIPGFNVEDLVSRYHAQEKKNAMTEDGDVSECNEDNLGDKEFSQTDMESVEGDDLGKFPEENSENEEMFKSPVQESQQCSSEAQSSGILEEQTKEKNEEMIRGDVEDETLQQTYNPISFAIGPSAGILEEKSLGKEEETTFENTEDEAVQQIQSQNSLDIESSGIPQEQSKDEEIIAEDLKEEAIQQTQTQNSLDIESGGIPQEQSIKKDEETIAEDLVGEVLQQTHSQNNFDVESSSILEEQSKEKDEEMAVGDLEDETLRQNYNQDHLDEVRNTNSLKSDRESISFPESVFEYFVVEDVCLSLIPTDDVIQEIGGVDKWKNTVSLVLSSVAKYRIPIEISYFLKVCNEFANLISPETESYSLFVIGERGKQVDDHSYLDSQEIFQSVCDSVQDLRDRGHDETKLSEFLFQFYERCIESNPDSLMMGEILSRVSQSEDENMLHLASSILHQILLSENDAFTPEHLEDLITSTELEEFPNLTEIDYALSLLQESEKELDCHVNVICCDLINKLYFKDLDIKDVTSSNDPLLRHFHQAVSVLSENDENLKNTGTFRFICAVSYLRAFMSKLARLLSGGTKTLDLVLSDICEHLQDDQQLQKRNASVWTFFVKELCQVMCLYDVKTLIQSHDKTHPLMPPEWKEEDTCKLEYNPFELQAATSKVSTPLGLYVESKDPKPFVDALESILKSCEKRKELAAIVIEMFYIVRSCRKLKDTEDSLAEFVTNSLTKFTPPYKSFISRISSQQSFQCKMMEISSQTTTIDFEIAVLIQHLCAILTSSFVGKSRNPIMCCLVNPKALKTSCMVALPDNDSGYPQYKHFKSNSAYEVHLFSCKCGTRFVSQKSSNANCPCCDAHHKDVEKCAEEEIPANKGYVSISPEALKCDLPHVRNLDPVEFRILHLIVHAALLGGYSLDLSTDVLHDVMGYENPSDTCYDIVQIDLEALSSLFCCKKEKIVTLLHHVIESVSQLLTEDSGLPVPLDEKGRSSWEAYFAKNVKPLVQKFHCDGSVNKDEEQSYKTVIEERPLPEFTDVTSRNASVPRLFRVTQPNTFNKLREVYLNSPKELKEKHQLLGLFLDHHDTLHLIGNLVSLLSWNRRVESLLSRAITRKDAKEKKIYDVVISKELQTPNEDKLNKAFEEFKKAWRKVVPLVNESIEDDDKMPYISEMNPVGYCLAEKDDLGRYLCKSFAILATMQNTFLDNCLAIASTGKCPALHFLSKEGSDHYLPIVHVQDAKKREIIKYEWTDKFLAHSHCATEYGQGRNITYDMAKMEKELAGCFLLGKAYLDATSGIREFVFSKQLFHDCANILNELCESIPQDKLPSSVEAELGSSARKSMDRMQTLLEHMELVLWYLKRIKVKPEISLVEFSDTCILPSRVFPKDLLPTTLNVIQIKHVCALYEFVEDQLAAPSVDCLEERYRKNDATKKKLEEISTDFGKTRLEAVITAIKRFVFRYLHMKVHPDESLVEYMRDPSLWPIALRVRSDDTTFEVSKEAPKFFPKEITIGEIYETHTFYNNLLKKLNVKMVHPRHTTLATATRQSKPSRKPNKKRMIPKSGGFS